MGCRTKKLSSILFGLSCAGSSIGLFAFDALKFLAAKGHAGAVAGDVEDGRRPLFRVGTLVSPA